MSVIDMWIGKMGVDQTVYGVYHFMDGNYSFEVKSNTFIPIIGTAVQNQLDVSSETIGREIIGLAKRMRKISLYNISSDSLDDYPNLMNLGKITAALRDDKLEGI